MHFPKFLKIGVIPLRHVIELSRNGSNGTVTFKGGVEANFIKVLSEALGFDYNLTIPKDKEWGRHPLTGRTWTGLIGMVERNETDIAIGDLTITKNRASAVDFIPYTVEDNTFATRLRKSTVIHGSYTHPFQWQVWIVTVIAVVVIPLLFRMLMKKNMSFMRLFMVMLGCIVNQPVPFQVKYVKDRILLISWLLFGFFLASNYTGLLLMSITFPVREQGVTDIASLAKSVSAGKFKCMAHRGSFKIDMLKTSLNEDLQIIGRNIIEKDWFSKSRTVILPSNIDENIAVLGPRWMFHLEYGRKPFMSKYIFKESCGIWSIGIAVRKGFCCKKQLAISVARIMSTGIFNKMYNDQVFKARRFFEMKDMHFNSTRNTRKLKPLTLQDLEGAFILLLVGWMAGILVSLIYLALWYGKRK
ncbi:hypothetical protein JTE90_027825 [Oedothorax gibbosus]|uniref:Ionotropic glutamate receptor L-glutamate and glycine-binding domain-containing protein n=1 Tax=Oedothorax gibbosus TaxID=931172 RepID=A0AAV6U5M5_9ARAC|nr:hypothetical protein JTE90_027825 [Oedothorax gibbosus]